MAMLLDGMELEVIEAALRRAATAGAAQPIAYQRPTCGLEKPAATYAG